MKISDGVEWGAPLCDVLLAVPGPGGVACPRPAWPSTTVSPAPYLAKHLQAMSRAGILESVQGPGGGYRLARPAAEISVLDVVEAIDGRESGVRLLRDPSPWPLGAARARVPRPVRDPRSDERRRRSVRMPAAPACRSLI